MKRKKNLHGARWINTTTAGPRHTPNLEISLDILERLAGECGLKLAGAFSTEQADCALAQHAEEFRRWQESGFAAEMNFLAQRRETPALEDLLPGVRSVICVALPYCCVQQEQGGGEQSAADGDSAAFGRVARYAWGRDYHVVLKERLKQLAAKVDTLLAGGEEMKWRVFCDAAPFPERALLLYSGKGFIGKNTLFVWTGVGPHTFLAEMLWNISVTAETSATICPAACGDCRRCQDICPTAAFPEAYFLDARRCISYLTIEKKTEFNAWERKAVGQWVFGCDLCQGVCPCGSSAGRFEPAAEFGPGKGAGPLLSLTALLDIRTDSRFAGNFSGTPLMRAGRDRLLRNACCVTANNGYLPAVGNLIELLREDRSQLVRRHAQFALQDLVQLSDGLDRVRIERALQKAP